MRGFLVLAAMAVLFLNLNLASGQTNPTGCSSDKDCKRGRVCVEGGCIDDAPQKHADETPITFVSVPRNFVFLWKGPPRGKPDGRNRCADGTMPLVAGTPDSYGGWTHEMQLGLDWERADQLIARHGSGKWAQLVMTYLKGTAVAGCVPELKDADKTPAVDKPRAALTAPPEKIEVHGSDNLQTVPEIDTLFAVWAAYGVRKLRGDTLYTPSVGFRFRKNWYLFETDFGVPYNGSADEVRKVAWNLGVRPISVWLGAGDVGPVLRGGLSGASASSHPDELMLGGGVAGSFRPLWWVDGWWSEFLEFHGEVLAAQTYQKGDGFTSAPWSAMFLGELRTTFRF